MIEAIKDNWWAEKPKPVPVKRLGWRPIDPYCVQDIPYYDLTRHRNGSAKYPNSYWVAPISGYTPEDGVMLQMRKGDGTIRKTGFSTGYNDTRYLNNDIMASTIPPNKLLKFHARYNQIKELLFIPSKHTPELREILLRGNELVIDEWDFTNCRKIQKIENSIGLLKSIKLPSTGPDDNDNYFDFAYIGHFYGIKDDRDGIVYPGFSPPEVIDKLIERAYFSKTSYTAEPSVGARYKQFNAAPQNAHLYHGPNKTLPYHKILAQERKWQIDHLSLEAFKVDFSKSAQTKTLDLYNSTPSHEIHVRILDNPSWLNINKNVFYHDVNNIQTINITAATNNTGASRTATIEFRKLKTYDNLWEMHYSAKVKITQNG